MESENAALASSALSEQKAPSHNRSTSENHTESSAHSPTKTQGFPWAICISVAAFALSFASFYLTYLYEEHTLKVAVTRASVGNGSKQVLLDVDVVLRNDGNRVQVLLAGELFLRSQFGMSSVETKPPIIMKPGEAAVLRFRGADSFESLSGESDWNKEKLEGNSECILRLVVSGKSGEPTVAEIPVLTVRFDGGTDQAESSGWPRKIEWIELIR